MKAVARELIGRDIAPHDARVGSLGQQLPDQVVQLLLGSRDMLTAM